MRLLAFRTMLGSGGMVVGGAAAWMGRDAHAAMKDLHGRRRPTGFQQLSGQLIRHTVIMSINLDVIIQVGPHAFPGRDLVAFRR